MLLAYLDEIGEPGPFVAKTHPRFNTSPAFGYAGFVVPEESARSFGSYFTYEKRQLFSNELESVEDPGQWERKGSDIFTRDAWKNHRNQIRVFRGLVTRLGELGGKVFYYADQKEIGTRNQVQLTDEVRESEAMRETVNRLCRHAASRESNLLILMDQVNENQRAARVQRSYAHIFSRSQQFPEMETAVEPPMHVDSRLSSNIQFADWIATAVGRAIEYQVDPNSHYDWIPKALGFHFRHKITTESKLHLWQSSIEDLNHISVFHRERPALETPSTRNMSEQSLRRLEIVKHATARAARRFAKPTPSEDDQ